jgi:hypothetical protein
MTQERACLRVSRPEPLGWACFVLPIAHPHELHHVPRTVILGTMLGGLMVAIAYVLLFRGMPHELSGLVPYEASGMANAATAATSSLWILRRQ